MITVVICPGIALGVMASVYGLWELGVESMYFDGIMEDLVAIVEVRIRMYPRK